MSVCNRRYRIVPLSAGGRALQVQSKGRVMLNRWGCIAIAFEWDSWLYDVVARVLVDLDGLLPYGFNDRRVLVGGDLPGLRAPDPAVRHAMIRFPDEEAAESRRIRIATGDPVAIATAVNNFNEVVLLRVARDRGCTLSLWCDGEETPLPLPEGEKVEIVGLNDAGLVVGTVGIAGRRQPFCIRDGRLQLLCLSDERNGAGISGVTADGLIFGCELFPPFREGMEGSSRPVFWRSPTELVPLDISPCVSLVPQCRHGRINAIFDGEPIIGQCRGPEPLSQRAFLWESSTGAVLLQQCVPDAQGWTVGAARGILGSGESARILCEVNKGSQVSFLAFLEPIAV